MRRLKLSTLIDPIKGTTEPLIDIVLSNEGKVTLNPHIKDAELDFQHVWTPWGIYAPSQGVHYYRAVKSKFAQASRIVLSEEVE